MKCNFFRRIKSTNKIGKPDVTMKCPVLCEVLIFLLTLKSSVHKVEALEAGIGNLCGNTSLCDNDSHVDKMLSCPGVNCISGKFY